MKPAWDELMEEYKDSPSYLVADVDCTADGKTLCAANGVRGYPTIMYGDPGDLQKYSGGRDLESLKKHVETIEKVCSPSNTDNCSDDQKEELKKFEAMTDKELQAAIDADSKELKEGTADYEKKKQAMESEFNTFKKAKGASISLMKSVAADKAAPKEEL